MHAFGKVASDPYGGRTPLSTLASKAPDVGGGRNFINLEGVLPTPNPR